MLRHSKVKDLDELATLLAPLRGQKRIVMCHGVFDLLHIGHIRHFEQAKRLGDTLLVTVTPDRYVNKGPHRPAFTEELRAEAIAALDCVDYVAINRWPTAVDTIKLLRPNLYVKGTEYSDLRNDHTGKIVDERQAIESVSGNLAFTDDITFSSSALINRHFSALSPEVAEFLDGFRSRYSADQILPYLDRAKALKVLVLGETIIDDYQYCEAIGKSAKEPVLATRYVWSEQFPGGILAVANHVANFCDNVAVLTYLGDEDSQEDFVRSHLNPKIELVVCRKKNSPTIVKRRFVESYLLQKLFEVYVMSDAEPCESEDAALCAELSALLSRYDLVITADYGHGMLTRAAIELLSTKASFLAVNTQSNAGNRGLNTISKYPRVDYVCLAQHELALEMKHRRGDNREMILDVCRRLACERMMVTRGKHGTLAYAAAEGFSEGPAFTQHVVDRMGAGDAVLSLTSLCVAQGMPMEVVGFIGNVVGAQAVGTLGHKTSIERAPLFKHIESLLK